MDFNQGGCGCWSSASGYFNKNKKDEALCCPTKDWQNDWAQAYCVHLPDNTPCTRSYQCTSGYCENEGSAAALCQPKKKSGSIVHWNDGWHCASGTSAWWNKQNPPNNEGQCCPTVKKFDAFAQGWCSELVLESPCTFSEQCASGVCSERDSPNGVCVEGKSKSGSLVHWNDGSYCESGTSAWWNKQNPPNNEGQCCPTYKKFNAFSQGWCSELVLESPCTFNEQCASGVCSARDSPDGICVNTDFGKGCSEHNQCKSEWCHAGKCK